MLSVFAIISAIGRRLQDFAVFCHYMPLLFRHATFHYYFACRHAVTLMRQCLSCFSDIFIFAMAAITLLILPSSSRFAFFRHTRFLLR